MYDLIVIGSGISSICFFDTLETKNRKIAVVSYKNESNTLDNNDKKINFIKKNLPPRFSANNKHELRGLKNYFTKNSIRFEKKTSIFGFLDEGGVSNYWGCSCQFLNDNEIDFLNNENKIKLINSFEKIYKNFHFTGVYNHKIRNKSIIKKNNLNTIFSKLVNDCSDENIKYYENCNAVDNLNNKLFVPKNYNYIIDKKAERLNYFVKKIRKVNNIYEIFCEKNNKEKIIQTKNLILATGTIATTKLVADMIDYSEEIEIDHNPMLFGLFLGKKNIEKEFFLPSSLAAEVDREKNGLNSIVNFRSSNETIQEKIFKNFFFMKNIFFQKIYKLIDKKIIFSNLYIDSKFSCLKFKFNTNKEFIIKLKNDNLDLTSNELNKCFNLIYKNLRENNIIYPIKYSYVPTMGTDNHYTGTIPINGKGKLSLNENCELKNYKGLYIIDGSAIPKNKLKFPTGLIMANARRIGEII